MSNSESQRHRIRMSIDIHSIKSNNFTGNIYMKYDKNLELSKQGFGIEFTFLDISEPFRTPIPFQLT